MFGGRCVEAKQVAARPDRKMRANFYMVVQRTRSSTRCVFALDRKNMLLQVIRVATQRVLPRDAGGTGYIDVSARLVRVERRAVDARDGVGADAGGFVAHGIDADGDQGRTHGLWRLFYD